MTPRPIVFILFGLALCACSPGGTSGHGTGSPQNFSVSNSAIYGSATAAQGSPAVLEHQCHMTKFEDGQSQDLQFSSTSERCLDPNDGNGPLTSAGFKSEEISLINDSSMRGESFVDLRHHVTVRSCPENNTATGEYCVSVPTVN